MSGRFERRVREFGVIRVSSIEELMTTAGVLAHTGPLSKPGVGVVSISGGACGLFGDAAEQAGVPVPAFAPETVSALRGVQADYGSTLNPFDITGAAVADPSMFGMDIISRDPAIGLTVCGDVAESGESGPRRQTSAHAGRGVAATIGQQGIVDECQRQASERYRT